MIHGRGMAYVDLEKCENVVVGDDGRPYLVDFQIAWRLPRKYGGELWPMTWLRRRLQLADYHHVAKLQRRTRPDQLTAEELQATYRKPPAIRLWNLIARPFKLARRRILDRLGERKQGGERGRVDQAL